MICIPVIVICEGEDCGLELSQRIPMKAGMMNMVTLDLTVAPEGWGFKKGKLVCPECLGKSDLRLVKR